MASEEGSTRVTEISSRDRSIADPNHAHANSPDTILLTALHDFIIPLMQGCAGQESIIDVSHSSPEARKLLAALKDFVSGIISSSQPSTQNSNSIEMNIPDSFSRGVENYLEIEKDTSSDSESLDSRNDEDEDELGSNDVDAEDTSENVQRPPVTKGRLMVALREHVFNTMPIRLLSFKSEDNKFQIELLERGVIHGQVASKLQAEITETDFLPQINKERRSPETDEEIIERLILKHARYAILSHTWLRGATGEVTFGKWRQGVFDEDDPGYQKLVNFCKASWSNHGLTLGWMDTVCINKESSAELDESIRSMYSWYRKSEVCLTYLAETSILSDMHQDTWFTRGWTLQELLAPRRLKFYDSGWKLLIDAPAPNDKRHPEIVDQINQATSITEEELRWNIVDATISRRMQLAARREVTREEDTAYSLMGIFNISISIAYGEGAERAFFRLLKEILSNSADALDVFNWAGEIPQFWTHVSSLLPSNLKQYLQRSSNTQLTLGRPIEPLTLTHLGLHVPFLLMPAISIQHISPSESEHQPIGDYQSTITIAPVGYYKHPNPIPTTYHVLDKRISGKDGKIEGSTGFQMSVGVLNFGGNDASISIHKTCFAVGLVCSEETGKVTVLGSVNKIFTKDPIVFDLNKKGVANTENDPDADQIRRYLGKEYYIIKRSRLARHGIQLINLYL
ncbi:hypothetical protein BDN70DRAFT_991444 [Pholiota conissans]|uniref:Heterokaryon incompatibility domain-containing protein n=1 Tax=Pholiota conissans TaxID=109636 RepID=A0A9P5Z9W3_9AGAR|nr:hypothetical protein BDN70DRAFT_991444 [Pholiota conissans]